MMSCVLFVTGCNFDCPFCHNPALARNGDFCGQRIGDDSALNFLKSRKGFLDGVVISGGEPSLQADLEALCRTIKAIGYQVKVDTNGSRPNSLKRLIDAGLVDYIALDIKTDPFKYESFTRGGCGPESLLSSIRIIMDSGIPYEFRTTCVKPFVDEEKIEAIAKTIPNARLFNLQRFQKRGVLHPEYFRNRSAGYEDAAMARLKEIAEPWVQSCIVR